VARSVEERLIQAIARIRLMPEAAPRVLQRSPVRALAVVRHAFRIFYRLRDDNIDILHFDTGRGGLREPSRRRTDIDGRIISRSSFTHVNRKGAG